ncbi:1-phosphatidylinositol 4,5-bisphosphate phosphodiesterase gamma-2-like [Arapaima gigas]
MSLNFPDSGNKTVDNKIHRTKYQAMTQQREADEKNVVAKEMSDLVVRYQPPKIRSFVENSTPLSDSKVWDFIRYNRKALSHIDSSNYDPFPLWLCGCHMVALNFHTAGTATSVRTVQLGNSFLEGKFMQVNKALFSLSGGEMDGAALSQLQPPYTAGQESQIHPRSEKLLMKM